MAMERKERHYLMGVSLVACLVTASAQAAQLYDRGNGMIYDAELNITWLQDANYAATSNYDADGRMTWTEANTWANNLSYGGYDDWRLASVGSNPSAGFNVTSGELGHMFYNNLSNTTNTSILNNVSFIDAGDGLTKSFSNVQSSVYWYGEEYAPGPLSAWAFRSYNGFQLASDKGLDFYSWAVRDGDVAPPVPTYSCRNDSFEAPFDVVRALKKKQKAAIPVKMQLKDDDDNPITPEWLSTLPVVSVTFSPAPVVSEGASSDLVPPGLSDDGNAFRWGDPYWILNLATKQFSASGTYTVIPVAGDESYTIDPASCTGTFVRLQ